MARKNNRGSVNRREIKLNIEQAEEVEELFDQNTHIEWMSETCDGWWREATSEETDARSRRPLNDVAHVRVYGRILFPMNFEEDVMICTGSFDCSRTFISHFDLPRTLCNQHGDIIHCHDCMEGFEVPKGARRDLCKSCKREKENRMEKEDFIWEDLGFKEGSCYEEGEEYSYWDEAEFEEHVARNEAEDQKEDFLRNGSPFDQDPDPYVYIPEYDGFPGPPIQFHFTVEGNLAVEGIAAFENTCAEEFFAINRA